MCIIVSESFDDILRVITGSSVTYFDISMAGRGESSMITLTSNYIVQKLSFRDTYNVFGM